MLSGTQTTDQILDRLKTANIFIFYVLLLMNSDFCRITKINSVILKDTASFQASPSVPKMQMARQTDSFI